MEKRSWRFVLSVAATDPILHREPITMAALANSHAVALGARAVSGRKVVARKATLASRPARAGVVVRAALGERKFNFSAGPACLPLDVLEDCKEDLINYKGTGMSVMEMSHRGKDFMNIASEAEADLRELVGIPVNYKVRALIAAPIAAACARFRLPTLVRQTP